MSGDKNQPVYDERGRYIGTYYDSPRDAWDAYYNSYEGEQAAKRERRRGG